MDNASTDEPTREYLVTCGLDVRYNKTNNGPWVSSGCNQDLYNQLPDEFILTDPDLEFNENLPIDFISRLSDISNKYRVNKTGFALKISDFDAMYQCTYYEGRNIRDWESQFWADRISDERYELYNAGIDTTFALINKRYGCGSIRVAGDFTAKHIPWYVNNRFYTKDEIASYGGISSISAALRNA